LRSAGLDVVSLVDGRARIGRPSGGELDWLKGTGILAGFEAMLRLEGEVGEFFEAALRSDREELSHHYAMVYARRHD
jgi:hypothetical protein